MTLDSICIEPIQDPVRNVLKWVLLVVAVATFDLLA
jgi:hypothetical protein